MDRDQKKKEEKQQRLLGELLARPENQKCADCSIRGPKWASVSIGCFLCIRCAGLHRKMGSHISKVKSTNLDTWNQEWIDFVASMGNDKVNQMYLSRGNAPPVNTQNDSDMETFIRNKYERKLYSLQSTGYTPQASNNDEYSYQIHQLQLMGFNNKELVAEALQRNGGNLERSIEYIVATQKSQENQSQRKQAAHHSQSQSARQERPQTQSTNQFANQQQQLQSMGFTNQALNLEALQRYNGNLEKCIDYIVSKTPASPVGQTFPVLSQQQTPQPKAQQSFHKPASQAPQADLLDIFSAPTPSQQQQSPFQAQQFGIQSQQNTQNAINQFNQSFPNQQQQNQFPQSFAQSNQYAQPQSQTFNQTNQQQQQQNLFGQAQSTQFTGNHQQQNLFGQAQSPQFTGNQQQQNQFGQSAAQANQQIAQQSLFSQSQSFAAPQNIFAQQQKPFSQQNSPSLGSQTVQSQQSPFMQQNSASNLGLQNQQAQQQTFNPFAAFDKSASVQSQNSQQFQQQQQNSFNPMQHQAQNSLFAQLQGQNNQLNAQEQLYREKADFQEKKQKESILSMYQTPQQQQTPNAFAYQSPQPQFGQQQSSSSFAYQSQPQQQFGQQNMSVPRTLNQMPMMQTMVNPIGQQDMAGDIFLNKTNQFQHHQQQQSQKPDPFADLNMFSR